MKPPEGPSSNKPPGIGPGDVDEQGNSSMTNDLNNTPSPQPADEGSPSNGAGTSRAPGGRVPRTARPERQQKPRFPLTDVGNAERFVKQWGDKIRYAPGRGWLVYRNGVWELDVLQDRMNFAVNTVRQMQREIGFDVALGERVPWALKSEAVPRLKAMLEIAASNPLIATRMDQFDRDPNLLAVANGVLELSSGRLHKHHQRFMLTRKVSTNYNLDAECPRFLAFLERVFSGDQDLIDYVKRVVGYLLTGHTSEQVMFFLVGSGANGKSVFLEVIRHLLGTYARQVEAETLMARVGQRPSNDIAALVGVRAVIANESTDGRALDEGRVKQITGGDTITARFLFKEFFDYLPTFKPMLATNHLPVIKGTDHGIWRRAQVIPFMMTIPENERDPHLVDRLKAEAEGILAWSVQGSQEWSLHRLQPPEAVTRATGEYRSDMDVLADFITDVVRDVPGARVRKADMRTAYLAWCRTQGIGPLSEKALGSRLKERGYAESKSGSVRLWRDVSLASLDDEEGQKGPMTASFVKLNLASWVTDPFPDPDESVPPVPGWRPDIN